MKKKILGLVLALCLIIPCLVMLTACGKGDVNVVGTYSVTSVTMSVGGQESSITLEEYSALDTKYQQDPTSLTMEESMSYMMMAGFFGQTLKINEDNTFTWVVSALEESSDVQTGTWTLSDNTLTLSVEGEEEALSVTVGENSLTVVEGEDGEAVSIFFAKVDA